MKLYAKYNPIESELSRNKAKQKDNITNYLYKNDNTSFPTHSDTHFLSKYVENLTPFQIKLSRNKEKQTDNIQMTLFLFLFFTSTKLLVPKLSKTKRQEPKCPYLTSCPETK